MTVLAELLNQRKAAHERLNDVTGQIPRAAVVEEPDLTEEIRNFVRDLVREQMDLTLQIETLTLRINYANGRARVTFAGMDMPLMESVAMRDRLSMLLKNREKALAEIEEALGKRSGRYWARDRRKKEEVKDVSALDLTEIRRQNDDMAKEIRALDVEIQKINWSFEV